MPKFYDKDGAEVALTLEDVSKDIKDTIIKEAQGLVYANIDSKISEVVGVSKTAGEKTSDYIARVIKEKSDKIEELSQDSPDVAKLQADLEKVKELNVKLKGDLDTASKDFTQKLNEEYLRSQVAGLKITAPSHLDEEDQKAFVEDQKENLLNKFSNKYYVKQDAKGKRVIYSKSNNEPVTSENLENLPIGEIFKRDNAYLFKEAKVQEKQEAVDPKTGKPTGKGGYKTFEEITAAAEKRKMDVGSSEWSEFITKTAEESGIEF